MAVATLLADKSAYARLHQPAVFDRLAPLIERGLVATCSVVDSEVLYSARSRDEYEQVREERAALERLDIDQRDWDRVLEVQRVLAQTSRHRVAGIPDLLVAAVAERNAIAVLHYDHDFERIAAITGQTVEWVVAPGTVA